MRFLHIVPGSRLPETVQRTLTDLHRGFGQSLLKLKLDWIGEHVSNEVVFESQSVMTPVEGRSAVLSLLADKFKAIQSANAEIKLWLGTVDLPAAEGHPCLVGEQSGDRFLIAITATKTIIERIDILTVTPPPASATCHEQLS